MKDRLVYIVCIWLLSVVALLPLRLLYGLSDIAYLLVYKVYKYRRDTVRRNLDRSFPEKDETERLEIERKFYHHLCDCFVETIKLLHISQEEIDRRVEVRGGDLVERIASDGNPIVVYLGHYGNWEWVPTVTTHYYKHPEFNGQVYRPVKNKVMNCIMLKIRSHFPATCIPQKKTVRTLLKMKNEGKQWLVGFIADQRPNSSNLNHWTTFLNQETAYATGGEIIGDKVDAHYLYLDIEKPRRGHYRLTFKEILPKDVNREYPYTHEFMRLMEETIRRAPEYWLWSHKRWRIPKPENISIT